jgi:hypothetical protein
MERDLDLEMGLKKGMERKMDFVLRSMNLTLQKGLWVNLH